MGQLVDFPADVFARWRARFPEEAELDPDPREGCGPCCDCQQRFAWRGYDGLCAVCFEYEDGRPAT